MGRGSGLRPTQFVIVVDWAEAEAPIEEGPIDERVVSAIFYVLDVRCRNRCQSDILKWTTLEVGA